MGESAEQAPGDQDFGATYAGQRRIDLDHTDLLQQAGASQRVVGRLCQQIRTERRRDARQRAEFEKFVTVQVSPGSQTLPSNS